MTESPIENKIKLVPTNVNAEVDKIRAWFRTEYADKITTLNRDLYLGLPMRFSRYALEMEAYEKENRMRELLGEELLPEPKFKNII